MSIPPDPKGRLKPPGILSQKEIMDNKESFRKLIALAEELHQEDGPTLADSPWIADNDDR